MVEHTSATSAASNAQRRRSSITIIVPGDELKATHENTDHISNQNDNGTFESFKAKPRCITPNLSDMAHDGERENGMFADAGVMTPYIRGNSIIRAMSGIPVHQAPQSAAQDPAFPGRVASRVMPNIPTPAQQQQQQPLQRGGPSWHALESQPEDTHRFARSSSFTAAPGQKTGDIHGVHAAITARTSLHPHLPNNTPATGGTNRSRGEFFSDSTDDRRPIDPNGITVNDTLVASSSEGAYRGKSRPISPSSRLAPTPTAVTGMTGSAHSNRKGITTAMSPRPAVPPVVSALQNGAPSSGARCSSTHLLFPHAPSASPFRPSTMWTINARRLSLTPNYMHLSSSATDSHPGDHRGTMHMGPTNRLTAWSQTDPDGARRLTMRRLPEQQVKTRKNREMRGVECTSSAGEPLSPSVSTNNGEHRGGRPLTNRSGSTKNEISSVSLNDIDLASVVHLSSAIRAQAQQQQQQQIYKSLSTDFSIPFTRFWTAQHTAEAEGDRVLLSPLASPLLEGLLLLCSDDSSSNKDAGGECVSRSSLSAVLKNDQSTSNFSVLTEPLAFSLAASGPQKRRNTPFLNLSHHHPNSAGKAVDEKPQDLHGVSLSSYGLLPEDNTNAFDVVRLSASTSTVAPLSLSQLPLVQERPSRAAENSMHHPSPAEGGHHLASPRENESSLPSPRHHANSAPHTGEAKGDERGGSTATCTCDESGSGAVVDDLYATSNLQGKAREEDASMSSCSPARLSFTGTGNGYGTVDPTSDTTPHQTVFDTSSPGPADSQPRPPARMASAASLLAPAKTERWMVTQSLGIDDDFSFSNRSPEKKISTVAKLRNVFEGNKRQPCSIDSQAPFFMASPPPKKEKSSTSQASCTKGNTSSRIFKKKALRKTEGVLAKISPASVSRVGGSDPAPDPPQLWKTLTSTSSVQNNSPSKTSLASPMKAKSETSALPCVTNPLLSNRSPVLARGSSGTHFNLGIGGGSFAGMSPLTCRPPRAVGDEILSVRDSSTALPSVSHLRSEVVFSLACFNPSHISVDKR